METEVAKKLFTVDEYLRMGEAGIFDPEARLELIEGEIIEMSPVGDRHVQRLQLGVKQGGQLVVSDLGDCVFVPFIGAFVWNADAC